MSQHGAIDLDWADGTYRFRLGLSEIEELERKLDLSIFEVVRRLDPERRTARLGEITETLRLGLIGGGLAPVDALARVRRYVDERPIDENRDVAYSVAIAGLMRLHSSELESPSGEAPAAGSSASTSPPSTEARS